MFSPYQCGFSGFSGFLPQSKDAAQVVSIIENYTVARIMYLSPPLIPHICRDIV